MSHRPNAIGRTMIMHVNRIIRVPLPAPASLVSIHRISFADTLSPLRQLIHAWKSHSRHFCCPRGEFFFYAQTHTFKRKHIERANVTLYRCIRVIRFNFACFVLHSDHRNITHNTQTLIYFPKSFCLSHLHLQWRALVWPYSVFWPLPKPTFNSS